MNNPLSFHGLDYGFGKTAISIVFILGCLFSLPVLATSNTDMMNTSGIVTRVVHSQDRKTWDSNPSANTINNKQDSRSHSFFNDAQFIQAAKNVLNSNFTHPKKRLKRQRFKKKRFYKKSKVVYSPINKAKKTEKEKPVKKVVAKSTVEHVLVRKLDTKEKTTPEINPKKNTIDTVSTWTTVGETLPKLIKELSPSTK